MGIHYLSHHHTNEHFGFFHVSQSSPRRLMKVIAISAPMHLGKYQSAINFYGRYSPPACHRLVVLG